jgi:uncharacterized membrane protein YdjX (TVP38/TMEM64 family)
LLRASLKNGRFSVCRYRDAAGTVAFLPGSLFALVGGALFGPVWGAILNLLGATIGAGIAFLVARCLAGDWVAQKAAGRLKRLISGVEAEGWRLVAFVRLVSLFPFNLTNYALGLTRIVFLAYVVTSLASSSRRTCASNPSPEKTSNSLCIVSTTVPENASASRHLTRSS